MITQNSAIETIFLTMISLGAHKTVEVKGSKLKDVHLNGQAKAHFSNFALPPHA